MSFEDNQQFWEEFILLYKDKPCLWDVKSIHYRNKQQKNAAYANLIEKCTELFPNANKEFVIKKISSFRASFRRQLRRINTAKKSGAGAEDVSETTLWYFDLLFFLLDQEESRSAVSSLQEGDSFDEQTQLSETDSTTQETQPHLLRPETPETPVSRFRKQTEKTPWEKKKRQFLDASLKVLQEDTDQTTIDSQEITFGKNVGQQLEKIEGRQKIIAQKLISDVLYYAKLENLTNFSLVSTGSQPLHYQFPHTPQYTPQLQGQQTYNFPPPTQPTIYPPIPSVHQPNFANRTTEPQVPHATSAAQLLNNNMDITEELFNFEKRRTQ